MIVALRMPDEAVLATKSQFGSTQFEGMEGNGRRGGGLGRRSRRLGQSLGRSLGEDGGGGEQQNGGVAMSRELERFDPVHGGKTRGRHPKIQ